MLSGAELKVDVEPGGVAAMTDDLRLKIARELTTITTLYADLHTEALHRPANSAGLYIPGGDALNMLGPAANLTEWDEQVEAAEWQYFTRKALGKPAQWLDIADMDSDPPPPLLVLAWWEDRIRQARNQPTDLRATIGRATDYIRGQLDWIVDEYLDADFLLRDLRQLRLRMESILHEGIRPDRGVPCMYCDTLLVKIWGEDVDGKDDQWHCSTCGIWSNEEQYRQAVKYAARAHAKGLTAPDMAEEYRVPAGTVRVWAHRGLVRKRGKDASGRQLYDVADTIAMRDNTESTADVV